MILNVIATGSKGDSSGRSGINFLKVFCKNRLGKRKEQLAQMLLCLASSMKTQRPIPLLCTTIISGETGEGSGSLTIRASCSARISM